MDQLEWYLVHEYAYLKQKGVDYEAALDAIRCQLGDGINRNDFALQLQKFLGLFGDEHTKIPFEICEVSWYNPAKMLPFIIIDYKEHLTALQLDRTGLFDKHFPYIKSLDSIPMD